MTRHITIQIRAVTVFWTELGIHTEEDKKRASRKWMEMQDWLEENATRTWNQHQNGIWFLEPADAMFFKLVWAGQFK